jgi:Domain of unknown function (DUF4136)
MTGRCARNACSMEGVVMKSGLALLCFLLLLNVATLHAQDVAVDFDRSVDFSRFKTYSWVSGVAAKNPLIDQQIRTNIEEQLAARGLRRIEAGGDLSVLYMASVEKDLEVALGRGETTKDWMRQTTSGFNVRSQSWDVDVGTLVVSLSDASGKNLLWRAAAKTMLERKSRKNPMETMTEDAGKAEKKIRKALDKMFKQYPVVKSAV